MTALYALTCWDQAAIGRLKRAFEIADWNSVVIFLDKHPGLVDLLESAATHIALSFPGCKLGLEHLVDPESDFTKLLLYITVPAADNSAFDRLNKLDEQWWLDHSNQFPELCINLRYE